MSMAIIAITLQNEASLVLLFLCMFCSPGAHAADTLRPINWHGFGMTYNYEVGFSPKFLTLLTSNETLISEEGIFELGFFGGWNSSYLGIWFKNDEDKKAVWVANRNKPFLNSSCILQIGGDGNLVLSNCVETPTAINNGKPATTWNTSLTLLDSGNLVFTDQIGNTLWQSFDFPTNTFLPGMKIGWYNLKDRHPSMRNLVSWSSPDNPAPGDFILDVANSSSKSLRISQGYDVTIDIGSWDENSFRFFFQNMTNSYNFSYVSNEKEAYFTFGTKYGFSPSWLVIASSGQLEEYYISDGIIMSQNHFLCNQMAGNSSNASCLNMKPSKCKGDKFSETNGTMPLSLLESGLVEVEMENCEIICRNNCSCSAYSLLVENETVCQLYYGDKTHFMNVMEKGGSAIVYIRGDLSRNHGKKQRRVTKIILCYLVPAWVLVICFLACSIRWKSLKHKGKKDDVVTNGFTRLLMLELHNKQKSHHVMFFNLSAIETATNSFAYENKLGEGGFGPVYKGRLQDGQEIAVKRLSKASKQGLEEFKNEVTLISELQHRNLVKLLGCCIGGGERMLIYQYMPNASLDYVLFDSTKREKLDWRTRVNIIHGIAHGILYLHEFSGLKIVHRDLKPSNILLDREMNPKISDFGMAKMILGNETPGTTERVAGTFGYMAPEYAMDGQFSEKSDVFSFGIILLELISGRKNVALCDPNQSQNLVINAWKLWKEGKGMEFMDSTLSPCCKNEVIRFIILGLLCVQGSTSDRPTMTEFVSALKTDVEALPSPKEPSFSTARRFLCGQTDHTTFTDLDLR